MYAEFATSRLIDFLRASGSYDLEMVCSHRPLSFSTLQFTPLLRLRFICAGIRNLPRTRSSAGNGVPPWTNGQQQESVDPHYRAIRGRAPRD